MKIGELAHETGCPVETIRYYERIGVLMLPDRSSNNYRSYGERHLERLMFIRHCRVLDMTLDEVRELLDLRDHPELDCAGVNDLLDRHIKNVAERLASLTVLDSQLRTLRNRCLATDSTSACAILHALGTGVPRTVADELS